MFYAFCNTKLRKTNMYASNVRMGTSSTCVVVVVRLFHGRRVLYIGMNTVSNTRKMIGEACVVCFMVFIYMKFSNIKMFFRGKIFLGGGTGS